MTHWKIGQVHKPSNGHDSCGCLPTITLDDGSGARIAEMACGWPQDDTDRHARLIAAAPELLEALERIAGYCTGAAICGQEYDGSPFGPEAKRHLRDVAQTAGRAIVKARGVQ